MLEAADLHATSAEAMAADARQLPQDRFGVPLIDLAPRVFYRLTDNRRELAVRFIVGPYHVRGAKDAMSRPILAELDAAGIGIASTTYDIVGFPAMAMRAADARTVRWRPTPLTPCPL